MDPSLPVLSEEEKMEANNAIQETNVTAQQLNAWIQKENSLRGPFS